MGSWFEVVDAIVEVSGDGGLDVFLFVGVSDIAVLIEPGRLNQQQPGCYSIMSLDGGEVCILSERSA